MLLDCGEGTYGQLSRRYGAATNAIIAGLKCVWISHIHADHHAGLGRSDTLHAAPLATYWQLANCPIASAVHHFSSCTRAISSRHRRSSPSCKGSGVL